MHELSIALNIVDLVLEEPCVAAGAQVETVHLTIGALSGVAKDALMFSYEVACQDSSLAGSKLAIEEVPILINCSRCGDREPVESIQSMCCSACGTPGTDVVQGRELVITALEIVE